MPQPGEPCGGEGTSVTPNCSSCQTGLCQGTAFPVWPVGTCWACLGQHLSCLCGALCWAIELHWDEQAPRPCHHVGAPSLSSLHGTESSLQLVTVCHFSLCFPATREHLPGGSIYHESSSGKMPTPHRTEDGKVPTEVLHKCYFSPCAMYAVQLGVFFPLEIKELQRQFK